MSSRTQCPAVSASLMMAELAWASWETIVRRTVMMAQSTCSSAEYHRMLDEKTAAAVAISGLLFSPSGGGRDNCNVSDSISYRVLLKSTFIQPSPDYS